RNKQPSVRRELVDARVAVAVADVHFAFGGKRQVSGIMERRAASPNRAEVHAGRSRIRWLAARSQRQQQTAIGRIFANRVIGIVGAIDGVVGPDEYSMWSYKRSLAPREQELTVSVEHNQWVRATVEDVDA